MRIWLSYPLTETTPVYGGGDGFRRHSTRSLSRGESCNTERWVLPNHIGTHIDFPRHFFDDGASSDSYSAGYWHFTNPHLIDIPLDSGCWIACDERFEKVPEHTDILLIKTGFHRLRGEKRYWEDNPGISPEVALWLREHRPGVRAVGFDFISVSRYQDRSTGREAHRRFLDPNGTNDPCLLIEDMDLGPVDSETRWVGIQVSPLRVEGADGTHTTIIAEVE